MHAVIVAVVAVVVGAPMSDAAVRAYVAAYRGDLREARDVASERLANVPSDAGASFVATAVEIEDGNLDVARELTTRFYRIESSRAEASVLRALIEARRQNPSQRMADALADAWKAAGRPDLGTAGVLRDLRESVPAASWFPPTAPGALSRLNRNDAFLLAPLEHPLGPSWAAAKATVERWDEMIATNRTWIEKRSRLALEFSREPDSNSVGLNLCVYAALTDWHARRRVAKALGRALPDNGYVALAITLDDTSDRTGLTGSEVDAIAAAARKPRFAWPNRVAYAEIVAAARRLDPGHAELLARGAFAYCGEPTSPMTLARRFDATRDPQLRSRARRAADAVGTRLAESGSVLERMMGGILQNFVAPVRPGGGSAGTLHEWRERLENAQAAAAVGAWPLPSIWREWDPESEIGHLERSSE